MKITKQELKELNNKGKVEIIIHKNPEIWDWLEVEK